LTHKLEYKMDHNVMRTARAIRAAGWPNFTAELAARWFSTFRNRRQWRRIVRNVYGVSVR
jgi:hypothetical protein